MSTEVPFSTFTIRKKASYSQSAFCHSTLQPFANVIFPKQGASVLDRMNEQGPSMQYETWACALLAPAGSLTGQGRSQPVLGILIQFMETSLSFLLFRSFILFIVTSMQCSGDTRNPKVLALGSLSAVGDSLFQWLCCRNPVVAFLLVVRDVRQELQGQHGPYVWLLVTYRGFSSDWAYYTNLFTMEFDGFFSRWVFSQEMPPKSSLSTWQLSSCHTPFLTVTYKCALYAIQVTHELFHVQIRHL